MNPKNVLVISFKPQCKVSNLKWVTREYVHVDRTACPWLIKKFIDPEAEFIFVPTEKIEEVAKKQGAIPFDAPGVKLGHHDGRCSFETIIEEYKLKDPVLHELAKIVHSADTRDTELAPEGIGLSAIMTGARFNVKDDFEAVEKAAYVYDALYSYCKYKLLREKHKDELEGMNRKQQREFLIRKMRE
ncbi:chromate resistance protein [Candidatus Bathyarchaeota archaeon]|nr:MAG: chromate resistance protein [Candidatus Bathyarchaeota archaeon]